MMKTVHIQTFRRYYGWFFVSITVLSIFGLVYKAPLPEPAQILPAVEQAPQQTKNTGAVFEYERSGKSFWVEPTHDYKISGVVVSKNHMKSLLDRQYVKYDARIQDFCVIWGKNATSGIMENIKVRNSNFTCHYFSPDRQTWEQFNADELSNNHLLANDPRVIAQLKKIQIGDQIKLRGQLANYYYDADLTQIVRQTSTIREDTGNGACETFFVQSAEILKRSTPVLTTLILWSHFLFWWSLIIFISLWLFECVWEATHIQRKK